MPEIELDDALMERLATDRTQQEFYDRSFRQGGSFGVRVSRSGRKVFFLIYALNGRRKRLTVGTYPVMSLREARAQATACLREVAAGQDPAAERRRYKAAPTFAALAEQFLERHATRRCKPRTVKEYRRIIEGELLPLLGDRRAVEIGRRDVLRLIAEIAEGRRSAVMANRCRTLLGTIFKYGIAAGIVEANPVTGIAPPGKETPRERALTISEIHRIWKALDELPVGSAAALRLILLTAQRPSDVLAMRWQDLAFESWVLAEGQRKPLPEVPLSAQAIGVLRGLPRRSSELVFPGRKGSHLVTLVKPVERLNKALGFSWRFTPYDLRRSVEYRLRELGIRPDVVELIMNRTTTVRRLRIDTARYNYEADVRDALNRWGRTVAGSLPPSGTSRGKVIPLFGR